MRIIHATSVHRWDDVRIYHKMARSLAKAGCDVHVVALDRTASTAREFRSDGVTVHLLPGGDVGSRLARSVKGGRRVAAQVKRLAGEVVHLHDPELIPFMYGGFGKAKLVYDAHEDLVGQLHSKAWIPAPARPLLRVAARLLEIGARRADGLVAATPYIAAKLGAKAVAVQNFPLPEEFLAAGNRPVAGAGHVPSSVLYAGGISRARGTIEMIEAVWQAAEIETFHLAGTFEAEALFQQAKSLPGWAKVAFHGQLPRDRLAELMGTADIGLVTLLPHPNYVNSQPIKLFEYLGAALLVVASDFPAWRELLAPERLAEFVDPADPASIAEGLRRVAALPAEERERRRAAGRRMIAERVNWEAEFPKLLGLYERLVG